MDYDISGMNGNGDGSNGSKLLICMVGLSGCGKTYAAHRIRKFLSWKGYNARVITCSDTRVKYYPEFASPPPEFFDENNEEYSAIREKMVDLSLQAIVEYFENDGQIAIFDASNIKKSRREHIIQFVEKHPMIAPPMWIEMRICDESLIMRRFEKNKLQSLEYLGCDIEKAKAMHYKRIQHQLQGYDDLEKDNYNSCIVEIDSEEKKHYVINNINGYLPTTILSFLMNLHPEPRPLYFSRHGQSVYNTEDRIGGDSSLTQYGWQYATVLGEEVNRNKDIDKDNLIVWTSCLRRTQQTSSFIKCRYRAKWQALNEINGGVCEDITYKEMGERYPDLAELRRKDKLAFRYPQGESYIDIIDRLQPVVFELERNTNPIIVVSHQAVLRCLLAYFLDIPRSMIPHVAIPFHTLIRILPRDCSYDEERIPLLPLEIYNEISSRIEEMEQDHKEKKKSMEKKQG